MTNIFPFIFIVIACISLFILIFRFALNQIKHNRRLNSLEIPKPKQKGLRKKLNKQYYKQQRSRYNSLIYALLSIIIVTILMEYSLVVPTQYMWLINIGLLIFIFIFYKSIMDGLNKKQVLYQYAAQDKPSLFSQSEKKYFYETSANISRLILIVKRLGFFILFTAILAVMFSH